MTKTKKRKKSLVGWTGDEWSLYHDYTRILHWDIFNKKADALEAPVKVRITIEEI